MHKPAALALSLVAVLAGCSDQPATSPVDQVAQSSASSHEASVAVQSNSPTETASHITPAPALLSVRDLGLTVGVYAASGSTCPPAMAGLATFDGSGFGGRSATQCSFSPRHRNGQTFKGTQTCTDSYSKKRVTEDLTITVASTRRFTQENARGRSTFDLCPGEDLSDWTS